jgi:hypothetical protein
MSKPPRPKSAAPFPICYGFELPATSQQVVQVWLAICSAVPGVDDIRFVSIVFFHRLPARG